MERPIGRSVTSQRRRGLSATHIPVVRPPSDTSELLVLNKWPTHSFITVSLPCLKENKEKLQIRLAKAKLTQTCHATTFFAVQDKMNICKIIIFHDYSTTKWHLILHNLEQFKGSMRRISWHLAEGLQIETNWIALPSPYSSKNVWETTVAMLFFVFFAKHISQYLEIPYRAAQWVSGCWTQNNLTNPKHDITRL